MVMRLLKNEALPTSLVTISYVRVWELSDFQRELAASERLRERRSSSSINPGK